MVIDKKPLLSIVIPAFNEERRLPRALTATIAHLKAQPYDSEIIVVTDGSTDRTVEVAREFSQQFPDLSVLQFAQNRGKGFGVRAGMLAARGSCRLFMDADYAVPIELLDGFIQALGDGNDIVIGSRGLADSRFETRQAFPRQQLAIAFGHMQRLVLSVPYLDTQCGFKLFTAHAAEQYFTPLTFECAYFDAELLYLAHNTGARIRELPVIWRHDQETRLPIGVKRSAELLKKLLSIRSIHRQRIKDFKRGSSFQQAGSPDSASDTAARATTREACVGPEAR